MDIDFSNINHQIQNLGRNEYFAFVLNVLTKRFGNNIQKIDNGANSYFVYHICDDYGSYENLKGVFIVDDIPFDLFKSPNNLIHNNPFLIQKIQGVFDIYKDKYFLDGPEKTVTNQLFHLHIINQSINNNEEFRAELKQFYHQAASNCIWPRNVHEDFDINGGGIKSIFDFTTEELLYEISKTIAQNSILSIEVSEENRNIRLNSKERPLQYGIKQISDELYYPIFSHTKNFNIEIINEFEMLIKSSPKEEQLELFIRRYYNEIFGDKYDRIETQLWLKFPEQDINMKNRRLDIFLHNAIKKDLELFELKKIIKLTKTYRDIPVFVNEIYNSINQLKNYERILKSDKVKESLKKEGVEYYEPSLHLIIGNRPNVNLKQWRYLVTMNKDVNILTYGELIDEMKIRIQNREKFFYSYFNNNA